jgi:hypothetical protein
VNGDWKGEGALSSLSCQVIKTFDSPKGFQWGGMIQEDLELSQKSRMIQNAHRGLERFRNAQNSTISNALKNGTNA